MRRRSIHTLIVAAYAREPLTAVERRRLARYDHHWRRILDAVTDGALTRNPSMQGWEGTGDEYAAMRTEILTGLRKKEAPELRFLVRRLVALCRLQDDLRAELKGVKRRLRRQHQLAQQGHTRKTRARVEKDRGALTALRKRNPALTWRAAARKHLQQTDPTWLIGPDITRDRKVTNLLRRIYRRQKN